MEHGISYDGVKKEGQGKGDKKAQQYTKHCCLILILGYRVYE